MFRRVGDTDVIRLSDSGLSGLSADSSRSVQEARSSTDKFCLSILFLKELINIVAYEIISVLKSEANNCCCLFNSQPV